MKPHLFNDGRTLAISVAELGDNAGAVGDVLFVSTHERARRDSQAAGEKRSFDA